MTSIARTTSADAPKIAPIALTADQGEALWFIGSLTTIKASGQSTAGRVAVIEHLSPRGSGSPLHVHRPKTSGSTSSRVSSPSGSAATSSTRPPDRSSTDRATSPTPTPSAPTPPASWSSPNPPGSTTSCAHSHSRRQSASSHPGDRAARCRGDDATGRRTRHRDPRPSRNPRVTSRTRISEDPDCDSQRSSWTVSPETRGCV
jgi:hypothetical protein